MACLLPPELIKRAFIPAYLAALLQPPSRSVMHAFLHMCDVMSALAADLLPQTAAFHPRASVKRLSCCSNWTLGQQWPGAHHCWCACLCLCGWSTPPTCLLEQWWWPPSHSLRRRSPRRKVAAFMAACRLLPRAAHSESWRPGPSQRELWDSVTQPNTFKMAHSASLLCPAAQFIVAVGAAEKVYIVQRCRLVVHRTLQDLYEIDYTWHLH